jgi:4-diphosphocytidyl-2C-methyl-D-erythritol kinase
VDIFNLVSVEKRKDKLVSGRMKGMGMEQVPFEETNACKVAEAFVEKFSTQGVDITIYENIPVGAGLGGSSADAAGVLRALAKLYGVDNAKLYEIANRFGSDIAYMIDGGYARMQGRGEIVTPIREKQPIYLLLLCPNSSVSAGACYREFDNITALKTLNASTDDAISAYLSSDLESFGKKLKNDLTLGATALNKDVERGLEELRAFSPLGVGMTGSGSATFAIFETKELCEWAKSRYRGKFRAYVVKTVGKEKTKIWKNPFALTEDEKR